MTKRYELAIIGAGILGLAHAYWAAKAGVKAIVFERNSQAQDASVRNFGMLIGEFQATTQEKQQAQLSESIWYELSKKAGVLVNCCGALLIAMTELEKRVLLSFTATVDDNRARWLEPTEIPQYSQLARTDVALGALWMPQVAKVDQRAACAQISKWLAKAMDIEFVYDTAIESIDVPHIRASYAEWLADRVIVCAGDEYKALYSKAFADSGIDRCQLQMLRTYPQPKAIRNEPFILGGLSYSRYSAFKHCDGYADLRLELESRFPEQLKHGVHVIVAQEADGSITLGDSHHYGSDVTNNRLEEVDRLILGYMRLLVILPEPTIQSRWLGYYASLSGVQKLHINAADKVNLITITCGQGMTLSFAIAKELMTDLGVLGVTKD